MIATGTDIRPLEVLVFMRDVKSRSYYEQMKGRGTRTCSLEDLRSTGTPSAKYTKDHFVIIDAVGVENSLKTDSRPLEKGTRFIYKKDLLENVARGNTQEDILTSLANRLIRLDKQLNEREKLAFAEHASGQSINHVVSQLLNAHDPDTIETLALATQRELIGQAPIQIDEAIRIKREALVENAVAIFHNPELRNLIIDIRKKYDQIIDTINLDEITNIGWVKDNESKATATIQDFSAWIEKNKEEITALQIFYDQPYRRRELTYNMIKDLCEIIKQQQPLISPLHVWQAYEQLKQATGSPKNELIALVSLVRRVAGIDSTLTLYDKTVDQNFKDWVFKKQAGGAAKFTEEQMQWLRMIKDYIANSFHVDKEDFDLDPFNRNGGLGKMWQLFGERTEEIIKDLNEALVA